MEYVIGSVLGALFIPAIAVTLLVAGVRRRGSARREWCPPYVPAGPLTPPAHAVRGANLMIGGGSLLLVLTVLGTLGQVAQQASSGDRTPNAASRTTGASEPTPATLGSCVTEEVYLSGTLEGGALDCDDPRARYEFASLGDEGTGCPDGPIEDTLYLAMRGSDETWCFVPNLVEGECYFLDEEKGTFPDADCDGAAAHIEVVRRIDLVDDASRCGEDQYALTYPRPTRTLCLVAVPAGDAA